jgi:hypothetical protein
MLKVHTRSGLRGGNAYEGRGSDGMQRRKGRSEDTDLIGDGRLNLAAFKLDGDRLVAV